MNLESIAVTNCIGIVIVITVLYSSNVIRHRKGLDDRLFSILMLIIASCCTAEMVSFMVDGKQFAVAYAINLLSNTWLYFFNVMFSTLWCLYVDYKLYRSLSRLRRTFLPLVIATAVFETVILLNIPGHYIFSFSTENVYHRELLSYLFFVVPVVYVLISAYDVHHYRRIHHGLNFFPIWSFLMPFFLGCTAQAAVYGVSVAWCSSAIGMASLFMSLQNELVYQDPLTHLFNRQYLSYVLSSHNWNHGPSHSGLMIDVDYFKHINDTYGHAKGDEALCDTASILRDNADENTIVVRFAGDEFIALQLGGDEQSALKAAERYRQAVQAFNAEKKREYTLSLSIGTGLFIPGTSSPDSFLNEMDQHMYENKRLRHESGELQERRRR